MFGKMLTGHNIARAMEEIAAFELIWQDYAVIIAGMIVMFVVSLIRERSESTGVRQLLDRKNFVIRYALILAGILILLVFGIYGPGYNPAEFVYMQF